MLSTSGATVLIEADRVIKKASTNVPSISNRILEQGMFLKNLDNPGVPKVIEIINNKDEEGYVMELLYPLAWPVISYEKLIVSIQELLHKHVWHNPRRVHLPKDWREEHWAYISKRINENCPEFLEHFKKVFDVVSTQSLKECTIHGDPTFDNVMRRANGQLVLTDPIPAYKGIPTFKVVDYGKILQSACGYEQFKYNRPLGDFTLDKALALLSCSENEKIAALYFAAVHYVRLIPYNREFSYNAKVIMERLFRKIDIIQNWILKD